MRQLESVADRSVERVVHAVVGASAQLVVQAEREGVLLSGHTKLHLEQVAVDDLRGERRRRGNAVDAQRHVGIRVAEGRDNGEVEQRSNVPAGGFNIARNRDANRHLEDVHGVDLGRVGGFEVVRGEVREAQTSVRNNLEGAGVDQNITAKAKRECIRIGREVADVVGVDGNVVGALHVAEQRG